MIDALACSAFLFFWGVVAQDVAVGVLEGDFVGEGVFESLEGGLLLLDGSVHVCLNYNTP